MEPAKKLDAEIDHYLMLLTDRQKEAVLTVIKTFAEDSGISDYDSALKQELERRHEEYSDGGELISEAEAKKRIKAIINGKVEE